MYPIATQNDALDFARSNSDSVVVLYFGAEWCKPCKTLKQKIQSSAATSIPRAIFGYIDADNDDAEGFMDELQISSLPTLLFVSSQRGKLRVLERLVGDDWDELLRAYQKVDKK